MQYVFGGVVIVFLIAVFISLLAGIIMILVPFVVFYFATRLFFGFLNTIYDNNKRKSNIARQNIQNSESTIKKIEKRKKEALESVKQKIANDVVDADSYIYNEYKKQLSLLSENKRQFVELFNQKIADKYYAGLDDRIVRKDSTASMAVNAKLKLGLSNKYIEGIRRMRLKFKKLLAEKQQLQNVNISDNGDNGNVLVFDELLLLNAGSSAGDIKLPDENILEPKQKMMLLPTEEELKDAYSKATEEIQDLMLSDDLVEMIFETINEKYKFSGDSVDYEYNKEDAINQKIGKLIKIVGCEILGFKPTDLDYDTVALEINEFFGKTLSDLDAIELVKEIRSDAMDMVKNI